MGSPPRTLDEKTEDPRGGRLLAAGGMTVGSYAPEEKGCRLG